MSVKRIFFYFIIGVFVGSTQAQLRVKGDYSEWYHVGGVDRVVCFSKIDNLSEIHFESSSPEANVKWFTYEQGVRKELHTFSKLSPTHTYIDPKHNTGYVISTDGQEVLLWVLDLSAEQRPEQLYIENTAGERMLLAEMKQQEINRRTARADIEENPPLPIADAPEEGIKKDSVTCKISTRTLVRDALNENRRPKENTLEGSAPLDIRFFSNPTGPVSSTLWQIFKDGALIVTRTEQDHQYVFTEAGKYKVRLQVRGVHHTASDSLDVSVAESNIAVPKVFTPNGDGVNDEFRIAYTSIVEFNCIVMSRWGRVVYEWNDPQTGWNGTIGGKPATEGTYFYIVTAKGAEGKVYRLKGYVNLLR